MTLAPSISHEIGQRARSVWRGLRRLAFRLSAAGAFRELRRGDTAHLDDLDSEQGRLQEPVLRMPQFTDVQLFPDRFGGDLFGEQEPPFSEQPKGPRPVAKIPYQTKLRTPTDLAPTSWRNRAGRYDGVAKEALETGRNRLLITMIGMAVAFSLIGLRLADVTLMPGGAVGHSILGGTQSKDQIRADIVDRRGNLLATSLRTVSLYADPRDILDPDEAVVALMGALPNLDPDRLYDRLTSDRHFAWLRRNLTPREHERVNNLGIPGLYFRHSKTRVYPGGALAGHIVGFTDIDMQGLSGIEKSFDEALRDMREPIVLSIDSRVQHVVRQQLAGGIDEFGAAGGVAIILDVRTGEVMSMVSLPDFDPNTPGAANPEERFNRATLGLYEMGSTFKIFNTAMALGSGRVRLADRFDVSQPISVGEFVITDFSPKSRPLSVPEIFMYSSNIGSVKMALTAGAKAQKRFFTQIGLFEPAPIELPEVGAPLTPRTWRPINTMTASYGHGLAISPLQMASAVATVVNGGWYRPATILRQHDAARVGQQVLSPRVSNHMRRLMRLGVTRGTGRKAEARGYLIGGKTGSAEKVIGGTYRKKKLVSSFVGAFPMDDPRYVVLTMLDEPRGNESTNFRATGGWVAAPLVKRIVERAAPLLGVDKKDEDDKEVRDALMIEVSGRRKTVAAQ